MDEESTITQEQYGTEDDLDFCPKFSIDEYGNPIRDARFYPFVSRVISSANKTIASDYKYSHFNIDEE